MRISWLSAEEIAAARRALNAVSGSWDDHFATRTSTASLLSAAGRLDEQFEIPAEPPGLAHFDWAHLTEHVASRQKHRDRGPLDRRRLFVTERR